MLHQKQIEQLIAKKYHFLTRCEYIHSLFTSKGLKRNLKSQILKHRFFAETSEQVFELLYFFSSKQGLTVHVCVQIFVMFLTKKHHSWKCVANLILVMSDITSWQRLPVHYIYQYIQHRLWLLVIGSTHKLFIDSVETHLTKRLLCSSNNSNDKWCRWIQEKC